MQPNTVVEYNGIRLVVRSANVEIGMYRNMLADQARAEEAERGELPAGDLLEISRRVLHTMIYPSLIAATVEHEGIDWPITFDAFRELDEPFEAQWEKAVYALNPHWLPQGQGAAVDPEKKA